MKELRKKRLQELINSRFNGSQAELTKAMEWSSGRASQLLDAALPFGEEAAKKIAEKLGLEANYFTRMDYTLEAEGGVYQKAGTQMVNVVAEDAYKPTAEAVRLGMLLDMIPEDDLIRRSRAYSAATTAIVEVIEGHKQQPTSQPAPDQKKQPA